MLLITDHEGDRKKFYEILIPFVTGKPLETSLVEAEEAVRDAPADAPMLIGEWRSPPRPETRCY